jgi:hypothetical protein
MVVMVMWQIIEIQKKKSMANHKISLRAPQVRGFHRVLSAHFPSACAISLQ